MTKPAAVFSPIPGIPGILSAYGKAFNKNDDVCLVLKINKQKTKEDKNSIFKVDFDILYNDFIKKFPNHAEVEVISDFIPDIIKLHNACNILFSMSHAEGFLIPALDGIGAGQIVIAPNYSGHLDFLNKNNSLLVDIKMVRCPKQAQYWLASPYAEWCEPSTDHAAELLQKAVSEHDSLIEKFRPEISKTAEFYTWENAAKQILNLCEQ